MTPTKTARLMRGMAQAELAHVIGITPQQLYNIECGSAAPGPKILPALADALEVSAAYLRGMPQHLAVKDYTTGEVVTCSIISEHVISRYGIFYLVDVPDIGVLAVIQSDTQFTLSDWTKPQPMRVSEIGDYHWVDGHGNSAIMADGLPRCFNEEA